MTFAAINTQIIWFNYSRSSTCHQSDNAIVVRRFSKRRSKHLLNSIYKSCKVLNNWFWNVMDFAKVTKIYIPHMPNAFSHLMTISRPGTVFNRQSLLTSRPLLKTAVPLLFANKNTVKHAVMSDTLFLYLYVMRVLSFYFSPLISKET